MLPSRRRKRQECLRNPADAAAAAVDAERRAAAAAQDAAALAAADKTPGAGDASGDDDGGDGDGAAESGPVRKVVAALVEVDDSDAEPDCKSGSTYDALGNRFPNKPLRLWRTARDRITWHKELRRAEMADSLNGALFCSVMLLDRAQPLTVRLRNIKRMREAADAEAVVDAAAVDEAGDTIMGGGSDSEATQDGTGGGRKRSRAPANNHVGSEPASKVRTCTVFDVCGWRSS